MLKFLRKLFQIRTNAEIVYDYLAESVDLIDLERREQELVERGLLAR